MKEFDATAIPIWHHRLMLSSSPNLWSFEPFPVTSFNNIVYSMSEKFIIFILGIFIWRPICVDMYRMCIFSCASIYVEFNSAISSEKPLLISTTQELKMSWINSITYNSFIYYDPHSLPLNHGASSRTYTSILNYVTRAVPQRIVNTFSKNSICSPGFHFQGKPVWINLERVGQLRPGVYGRGRMLCRNLLCQRA